MRALLAPCAIIGRALPALLLAGFVVGAQDVAAAQTEMPLATRVDRLEKLLAAKGLVDLLQQVGQLQQEVRALRGELENTNYTLEQIRNSQRDLYADVDRRLATLEQGGGGGAAAGVVPALAEPPLPTTLGPAGTSVAGAPSDQSIAVDVEGGPIGPDPGQPAITSAPAAPDVAMPGAVAMAPAAVPPGMPAMPTVSTGPVLAPAVAPARGPTIDSAESEAAYRDAFGLLKAGQYEQSIAAFNSYLQRFPASQYNDNAQYWVGEAYYVMRQFEPAIAEYQKLITNYPASQKQPHAMLKMAYAYDELGQADQAAKVLTELAQRYPDSVAARLAGERLQRMRVAKP